MQLKTITFHENDGIGTITFNRPDSLNAFNMEMRKELFGLTEQLFYDDDVRVVVFTGAGRAFSAGGDIKSFDDTLLTPVYRAQLRQITRFYDDLEALEKPVIAALNGPATGAGIGLALACDIRIASEQATLGFREHFIGLISAAGGCSRLTRLVGLGKAKEIIFTGEMLNAIEAEKIGLVNKVVPHDQLMDEVFAFAQKLTRRAPQAIGLAKKVLNAATNTDQNSGVVFESLAQSILIKTEDHKEGVGAFLEKRKPEFHGR
jgi:enoyl-CoA hydratase/carnithine racemase